MKFPKALTYIYVKGLHVNYAHAFFFTMSVFGVFVAIYSEKSMTSIFYFSTSQLSAWAGLWLDLG